MLLMASVLVLFMVAMGLFVAVTVAVAAQGSVLGARRSRGRGAPPVRRQSPGAGGAEGVDPALAELRLRYARGEVGREEFLQRKIDLE